MVQHRDRHGGDIGRVGRLQGVPQIPVACKQVAELRAEAKHLERLLLLVEQYVPMCIAVGNCVRDAY